MNVLHELVTCDVLQFSFDLILSLCLEITTFDVLYMVGEETIKKREENLYFLFICLPECMHILILLGLCNGLSVPSCWLE